MSETVGKYLKNQRESKGITLEEIADETKIQKRYLEELENDEFDALPGEAYVKGFLRNYSTALKINSDEVIELYKKMKNISKELEENEEDEEENKEEIIPIGKIKKLNIVVLIIILALFVFGVFIIIKNNMNKDITTNVETTTEKKETIKNEEKSVNEKKVEIKESKKAEIPVAAVSKPLTTGIKDFEINIKGETWLEIKDGNRIVFSGFAYAGDKKIIKSEKSVYMNIGKVSNVELKLNGILLEIKGNEKDMFKDTWK